MKLKTVKVQAKDIENDSLIYLPKEKRFFWVDEVEHVDNMVIFYFEEKVTSKGIQTEELHFTRYQKVINVVNDLLLESGC